MEYAKRYPDTVPAKAGTRFQGMVIKRLERNFDVTMDKKKEKLDISVCITKHIANKPELVRTL